MIKILMKIDNKDEINLKKIVITREEKKKVDE